ncbi:MAG: hypothetical protein LBQ02_01785 [Candidatus Nomurabacteria bacterium]|jgi:hypothetical protein|nr:hypothetical protein [Candidatus Nomurabacteria bacterium]
MEKQTHNNELIDETPDSAKEQEKSGDSQPEMSFKQEEFLELIDSEVLLPREWGVSERPKISYFGIVSEDGVLAFGAEGRKMAHEVMADDDAGNIREASAKWEEIFGAEILKVEIADNQKSIDKRRERELAKVAAEKKHALRMRKQDKATQDAEFRNFMLRRGWHYDEKLKYLDERAPYGLTGPPDFANQLKPPNYYQRWLKQLFASINRKLDPSEENNDGTHKRTVVIKRNAAGKAIAWEYKRVGYTIEELAEEMVKKMEKVKDVRPELERMMEEITQYVTVRNEYEKRKDNWLSGLFAISLSSSSAFNEVERVNRHFEKALKKENAASEKNVTAKIVEYKKQLCEVVLGNMPTDETYVLPTGIVAYRSGEKILGVAPVFDEGVVETSDAKYLNAWQTSWKTYVNQNLKHDTAKLARGVNKQMESKGAPSLGKELFNKYDVQYDDRLIDEETGHFPPNIDAYDRKALGQFLDEYGNFIDAVKYSDVEPRFKKSIGDWREALANNVRETSPTMPPLVRGAFLASNRGLVINLDAVPADMGADVDVFGMATQAAIWENMDERTRESYFEMWGKRLNVGQATFVKLFGKFVYNATRVQEVMARVLFFNQFAKWQKGELDDGDGKDFFDKLAQNFKRPVENV